MRILTKDNYTIVPTMKPSVQRILRVTDPVRRRMRLKKWLDNQKTPTEILYALLTMAIASDRLALDKYGVFYVCEIARSERTTAVRTLEDQKARGYLTRKTSKINATHEKKIIESTDCPPLVKREYKPNERRTKKDDLAGVYKDNETDIPRRWVFKYIEGRALEREAYQFSKALSMSIVNAVIAISQLSRDQDTLIEWASEPRKRIEARLLSILRCYNLETSYQMIDEKSCRTSIFAGLALYDFERSQVHTFETRNVSLSKFLSEL